MERSSILDLPIEDGKTLFPAPRTTAFL